MRHEPLHVGQKTNSCPVSQFLCLPGQKERDWNYMTWSRDQPENRLSVWHEKNEAYEYSRLSSSPLGTFRRTQPQKCHIDNVKAFPNLVRSSDGLQYGISVVEAQTSLSWNVPSGKERKETAVFAGLRKCQVLHPKNWTTFGYYFKGIS